MAARQFWQNGTKVSLKVEPDTLELATNLSKYRGDCLRDGQEFTLTTDPIANATNSCFFDAVSCYKNDMGVSFNAGNKDLNYRLDDKDACAVFGIKSGRSRARPVSLDLVHIRSTKSRVCFDVKEARQILAHYVVFTLTEDNKDEALRNRTMRLALDYEIEFGSEKRSTQKPLKEYPDSFFTQPETEKDRIAYNIVSGQEEDFRKNSTIIDYIKHITNLHPLHHSIAWYFCQIMTISRGPGDMWAGCMFTTADSYHNTLARMSIMVCTRRKVKENGTDTFTGNDIVPHITYRPMGVDAGVHVAVLVNDSATHYWGLMPTPLDATLKHVVTRFTHPTFDPAWRQRYAFAENMREKMRLNWGIDPDILKECLEKGDYELQDGVYPWVLPKSDRNGDKINHKSAALVDAGGASSAPAASAAASTDAPAISTEAPAASTDAPAISTEAPAASTEAPAASTEAPAASTEAPAVSTEAPAASAAPANTDAGDIQGTQPMTQDFTLTQPEAETVIPDSQDTQAPQVIPATPQVRRIVSVNLVRAKNGQMTVKRSANVPTGMSTLLGKRPLTDNASATLDDGKLPGIGEAAGAGGPGGV